MKQKALIVESARFFQNMMKQIVSGTGVECCVYSTGKEALEAEHEEYTFILVARTLDDTSGEEFLQDYAVLHGLGDALTIIMTSSDVKGVMHDANKAGYKLVFNKKNLESLQNLIIRILNARTLDLIANVLFVESSQRDADVVITAFKDNNTTIHHVKKLSEMKLIFDEMDLDLVITDSCMDDDGTGDDVISYVRNCDDAVKSNVPILVVSAEQNQQKRTSFLRNGANDFILKPYDNDELLVRSSKLIVNSRLLRDSKEQQQQLMKLALTDHLTGLYNRHSLYDIGPKYISNAHRHNTKLSLLVIDLDHFKKVNDTRGHSVGDIVLQAVSAVMQTACRTEDLAARFGGEEFIMVLTNCDLDNALQKAEKLRYLIEACKPENIVITASIGVAELAEGDTFNTLFDKADKAVYEAKDSGRNKVVAIA